MQTADSGPENVLDGMDEYARSLYVSNPLREPIIRAAIQALQLTPGSQGLDAGCGIGLQAMLLAQAVQPSGHVTGLDTSAAFLNHGRRFAKSAGLSGQVSFREGDVNALPFDAATFDWLWSVDCAGYPAAEPLRLVKELARVVKPGGAVAILVWSSQMLLPGKPVLEARLNATCAGIAPFVETMPPESHYLNALRWFQDAGLWNPRVETFVRTVHAPLDAPVRDGLAALLKMRWAGAEQEVSAADWIDYQRLCQPESPDFILNRPDFYAFFTYSMFHATVAG